MKKKLMTVVLAAVFPCTVFAAGSQKKQSRPQQPQQQQQPVHQAHETAETSGPIPDTDSCGLGWQVTQKKTLSATTTRGTTNVFVPPTFGMTTGTIGCTQHPLSMREIEGARYAYNNFDALSVEMAEGHGEFLKGFALSMGCTDASVDSFSHMTQSHYRAIMKDGKADSLQMFDAVKSEIKSDPALSLSCNAV